MSSFGKKILSAFVEVTDMDKPVAKPQLPHRERTAMAAVNEVAAGVTEKFERYFDQLFSEANLPGPDYYEFTKMTRAMAAVADERSRYSAAFAGLSVQGLDKDKLLSTAADYVKLLETDAVNFNSRVDAALDEKVQAKLRDITEKQERIVRLNREISDLQNEIQLLEREVKENEEKIENNTGGYKIVSGKIRQQVLDDIEKIRQYIF